MANLACVLLENKKCSLNMGICSDSSEDFCISSYCNFWNTDGEDNEGLVDSAVHSCSIRNRTKIRKNDEIVHGTPRWGVLGEGGFQELNLDTNFFSVTSDRILENVSWCITCTLHLQKKN